MVLRRLLLLCEPGKDGAFDHVARLADYLARRHPEVVVDLAYSSRRSRPSLQDLVAAVRSRGGEAIDLAIGNGPQFGDLPALGKIIGVVRRHRPQLVHAHSSKAGALGRLLRGVWPGFPPVLYTPHAYYGMGRRGTANAFFFNSIEKMLGRTGVSIGASFDERAFGVAELGLPARRVVLINNGIDVARFQPVAPERKAVLREKLSLPRDATILVSVGRDSFQKNYRPLYRALGPILGEAAGSLFFVQAGAGAEALRATLPAEAQKHVRAYEHFEGIERLLGAADAFVLTSRYETLCLSALQALAAGLKIFLTRVPGSACLTRTGFRAISWIDFHPEEAAMAAEIGDSLRRWLAQKTMPDSGQAALARRHLSSEIQFDKTWRLYEHLLRNRPR
jgi:glycosyltransferase involved in cell wall biosynthesis